MHPLIDGAPADESNVRRSGIQGVVGSVMGFREAQAASPSSSSRSRTRARSGAVNKHPRFLTRKKHGKLRWKIRWDQKPNGLRRVP